MQVCKGQFSLSYPVDNPVANLGFWTDFNWQPFRKEGKLE